LFVSNSQGSCAVPSLDGTHEVEVVVDESRDDGRATDADHRCVGVRIARHFLAHAARDDPTVVNRERLDGKSASSVRFCRA
jgi:hypothetical protein